MALRSPLVFSRFGLRVQGVQMLIISCRIMPRDEGAAGGNHISVLPSLLAYPDNEAQDCNAGVQEDPMKAYVRDFAS